MDKESAKSVHPQFLELFKEKFAQILESNGLNMEQFVSQLGLLDASSPLPPTYNQIKAYATSFKHFHTQIIL